MTSNTENSGYDSDDFMWWIRYNLIITSGAYYRIYFNWCYREYNWSQMESTCIECVIWLLIEHFFSRLIIQCEVINKL